MSLTHVFSPKSIAIIGASTKEGSVGNDLVKNLTKGYQGNIYPVNPKGGTLYDLEVYRSVSDISQKVDLAVIAVPAAIVPTVLQEAGQKKIPAAVVISAGFKEAGNEAAEQELLKIADKYNITLIGPNCLGAINPHLNMNASFAPTMPPKGSIAFLSQSGALGTAILDHAQQNNLGFSKFLSLGNKAQVGETQLLEYLATDKETKVVLLYAEQITNMEAVLRAALKLRKTRHPKPIIVLKSGTTEAGMQAASSHTGALAGNDAFYDALFREAGIIRAKSVDEMFLYAECFAENKTLKDEHVAIVTNAGGLGVLVTDALVKEGLQLAELQPATTQKLASFLPQAAGIHNPVDILGDAKAERYQQTLEAVAVDKNVHAIAVLLTPQSMTEEEQTARAIVELKKKTDKPILVSFLGGARVTKGIELLENQGVTEVDYPEWIARGMGVLHAYTKWKSDTQPAIHFKDFDFKTMHQILATAQKNDVTWMPTNQVFDLLTAAKIPVAPFSMIRSESEAEEAVNKIASQSGKVVYKVVSNDIIHKSDAGGVMLGVTPQTAALNYQAMMRDLKSAQPDASIDGILVMEQLDQDKQELLLGSVHSPEMGTLLGIGRGGVHTEVYQDAAFTLLPVTKREINDVIERLQFLPILQGTRNQQQYDISALKEIALRIAYLLDHFEGIAELDINPLFVFEKGKGAVVVDARLRLQSN